MSGLYIGFNFYSLLKVANDLLLKNGIETLLEWSLGSLSTPPAPQEAVPLLVEQVNHRGVDFAQLLVGQGPGGLCSG